MTVLQGSFASAVINYVTTEDRFVPPEPLFSYTYSPQPDGRPQTNERYAPQTVRIHDLREHPDLTLETAGIQLVQAQSALREEDFAALDTNDELVEENDSPLCKLYRQEIDKVLRKVFPQATKIVTYNQRTRLHKPATTLAGYDFTSKENLPLMRPHIDLTPESASDFTKTVADGASRVLIVNAWRPIRGVVMDAPLAVADARTVDQKAKVHNRTLYRDGKEKGMFSIRDTGGIKWYYVSEQKPTDLLLFKQYDSQYPDHTSPHTAFTDPRYDGKEGVFPRYSIETRSIVRFD